MKYEVYVQCRRKAGLSKNETEHLLTLYSFNSEQVMCIMYII